MRVLNLRSIKVSFIRQLKMVKKDFLQRLNLYTEAII